MLALPRAGSVVSDRLSRWDRLYVALCEVTAIAWLIAGTVDKSAFKVSFATFFLLAAERTEAKHERKIAGTSVYELVIK